MTAHRAGRCDVRRFGAASVYRAAVYGPVGSTGWVDDDRSQLIDMQDLAWPAYAWSFPLADGSGRVAWKSLTQFVRATVLVAFVDAVGIMVVALILDVPFATAIGVLVFLFSFIPMIGAVISGSVAVLVALVAHGWVVALIMLGGVIAVQQIEANVRRSLGPVDVESTISGPGGSTGRPPEPGSPPGWRSCTRADR